MTSFSCTQTDDEVDEDGEEEEEERDEEEEQRPEHPVKPQSCECPALFFLVSIFPMPHGF